MNRKILGLALALLVSGIISPVGDDGVRASHMGTPGEHPGNKDRPLYVYPGNYRDEVNRLKEKFKQAFGYDLMELGEGWRPEEIDKLHNAFARLPENFYRIKGLKGFYRAARLRIKNQGPEAPEIPADSGIPAAAFPRFTTVYRQAHQSYQVALADEPLRLEFYNAIFFESPEDFDNIVHHEMAHVFDLSHGFLTFQTEWLALAGFHILHLPALDGKADSDFLYTLINDPGVKNYGPVSGRHLPTYSRENPQEDFANSVAAYIHYPYFKYTHPKRYQFIRKNVFDSKEYFKGGVGDYTSLMVTHFKEALAKQDWQQLIRLAREQSRFLDAPVEMKMVKALRQAIDQKISAEADLQLAIASCYLIHREALALRKDLLITRRIQLAKVFRNSRCRRMGGQSFEGDQVKWPVMQLRFYRVGGKAKVQFLDPVALTAYARGFKTLYQWRLSVTSPRSRIISHGESEGSKEPNGAFIIDLEQTAKDRTSKRPYVLPKGQKLIFEVRAFRKSPSKARSPEKVSQWARLQFVVQPDFEYLGPKNPAFQILYPSSWQAQR